MKRILAIYAVVSMIFVLGIGAVFLVLNGCYWWTRNLWPLVLSLIHI